MQWLHGSAGQWFGMVTYEVRYPDGRKQRLWLERQLVPASALRPRKWGTGRRPVKAQAVHAVLAKCGVAVAMTDLFGSTRSARVAQVMTPTPGEVAASD
jgi:hypothetical protein